jgi:hypothetical protein
LFTAGRAAGLRSMNARRGDADYWKPSKPAL